MKICIICFGPVESKSNGYFIRTYNIIKELSKKNHIYVLEFPENNNFYKTKLKNVVYFKLKGNLLKERKFYKKIKSKISFDPIHNLKFQFNSILEIKKHIKIIKKSDIIFIESGMFPFAFIISKLLNKKVVFDTNCLNILLSKDFKNKNFIIYIIRSFFWEIFEGLSIKYSDIILAVSNYEKNIIKIKWKIPKNKIYLVPNIIDYNNRNKKNIIKEIKKIKSKFTLKNKKIITFLGDFNSVQNRESAKYIIEKLAPIFLNKNLVFILIGRGKENFSNYPENVIFTGFVKDIDPYIRISDICISPLETGAGTKTKIIEYIMRNKLIVATKKSMEGFDIKSKYIITEDIENFPQILLNLINKKIKVRNYSSEFIKREKLIFKKNLNKISDLYEISNNKRKIN